MNAEAFAARLYGSGHVVDDFRDKAIAAGLVIVEAIRAPEVTTSGVALPARSRDIPVQHCLAHRVVALGPRPDAALPVAVGDIVKCKEAHLDPLDHRNILASIRIEHIKSILVKADG